MKKKIEKEIEVNVSQTKQWVLWPMTRHNQMFSDYSDKGTMFGDNTSQTKSLHNKI